MKLFYPFVTGALYIGLVLQWTKSEELGESPLYEYGEDSHVPEDVPAVNRKLSEADAESSHPLSLDKFIQEFHAKEEQESALIAKEGHEPLVVEELESTNLTSNYSDDGALSSEDSNNNSNNNNNTTTLVVCATGKESGGEPVELVNSTRLMSILITESNVTSRRSVAECTTVLFYARYCPFSCMAAPHFNALPRAFPDIKMVAVDAMKHPSFNTQYGIVGVPTVMLFHNGRPAAKFNDTEYTLEMFARFITKYTGLEPQHKLYVTSADFGGPVPSVPTKETDYCLALSWIFILVCSVYFFSKSSYWQVIVESAQNSWREAEAAQNTWREAQAQHEHGD
ncbi:thioredoxin domain-containing protein 15 [Anabrus simplex]|uniref:thioredoxin domain-containing protein 15 n=1 Tax=Anabrus simplex TaxID=316456 RepID=UPI0035A3D63B